MLPPDGIVCHSNISFVGELQRAHTQEECRHEPMFFGATVSFARENGGPIMQDFLSALPEGWESGVIDSRSHMLMPGWFPCIPGWHHDDVPRPAVPLGQHFASGGQPDYVNPRYRSEHILCLVGAAVAPTQFAAGVIHLPFTDGVIYRDWHSVVQAAVDRGELDLVEAPEGALIFFDDRSLHQGVPARHSGWRHFIRITRGSDRVPTNEIRAQVQVYMPAPMAGW